MRGRRNFKVRVRGKVRNQLLRRGGLAAGAALGLLAVSWIGAAGVRHYGRVLSDRLAFRPELIEVNCASGEAADTLRGLASAALKKPFSSARASQLAEEMRRSRPGLASVEIRRNFFTRRASVKAVPEAAVAPVLADGTTAYLGASGRLMPEDLSGAEPPAFTVSVTRAPRDSRPLADFVAALKPLAPLFYSPPAALSCDGAGWDCRLRLGDGTVVVWGGFEFTRLKILRLNEVMKDALGKSPGPLSADLRSFGEGKIFVSALKRQ